MPEPILPAAEIHAALIQWCAAIPNFHAVLVSPQSVDDLVKAHFYSLARQIAETKVAASPLGTFAMVHFKNNSQIILCTVQEETDVRSFISQHIHALVIDGTIAPALEASLRSRCRVGSEIEVPSTWQGKFPAILRVYHPPKVKPLPLFTAVIHVQASVQAIEQTAVALAHGAQGVFLIDHERDWQCLSATYTDVRREFPAAWIGLNFLDLNACAALDTVPPDADALWVDQIGNLRMDLAPSDTHQRIFGGAGFKYQPSTGNDAQDAKNTAARLRLHRDVVTTSGPGTGYAARVGKLQNMKAALPIGAALALASGVTPENAATFAPYVNCFLVATGISQTFNRFDPAKVRALANALQLP